MARYEPLTAVLLEAAARGQLTVAMSFGRVEEILGSALPPSSTQRQWWANTDHPQAHAWRAADFHVEQVDLDSRQVRFARGVVGGTSAASVSASADPREWPWENEVQARFASWLTENGWQVTGMADTATKARGVDLLAVRGERRIGAEVKGWPSAAYADPLRAGEVKPTAPTNQAGHWFAQALTKAVMLLDSHSDHESLVVLPDYPRYRDLARRTASGRARAEVHVVFVSESGEATSDTWAG